MVKSKSTATPLLSRITFWMAVGAAVAEASAVIAGRTASDGIGFESFVYLSLLAVPFLILAWISRRSRDRRILKPVLFFAVLCLAAWGLSNLVGDVFRFRSHPDHQRTQPGGPFLIVCGNWIVLVAVGWFERYLSRFSKRK